MGEKDREKIWEFQVIYFTNSLIMSHNSPQSESWSLVRLKWQNCRKSGHSASGESDLSTPVFVLLLSLSFQEC